MSQPFDINNINYSQTGNGPAMIWSHGLLACMQSEDALGIFAWHRFPKSMSLLRFDAKGHGLTTASPSKLDYLWPNLAEELHHLQQHCFKKDKVVLGGQSMGAASSLYAALAYPESIKGLVIMNPPVAWQLRASKQDYYRKVAKAAKLLGGKGLAKINAKHIDRMLPSWLLQAHMHSVLGMLDGLKNMKRQTLQQLFLAASENDLPDREKLNSINVPCLILAWDDDEAHPLSVAKILAKALPQAKLHVANNMADLDEWPHLISSFCQTVHNFE
ncbi:alpha/beta fold hydrolase [Shewanella gaetbuli]